MTNEIDALRTELAALRQDLDSLRLQFPDALLEGDIETERVTFMNRVACQVFRCSPEDVATMTARSTKPTRPALDGSRSIPVPMR